MGEWTILERLLEAAVQQHSTMIGRILLTVVVIFRILIVAIVGETVYEDEQIILVCTPSLCFITYSVHQAAKQRERRCSFLHPLLERDFGEGCGKEEPDCLEVKEIPNSPTRGANDSGKSSQSKSRQQEGISRFYVIQVVFRNALEIGFLAGQYFLYGFSVPGRVACERYPCVKEVECYVSRPTEKTVFLVFMFAVSGVSVLLNLAELNHLGWRKVRTAIRGAQAQRKSVCDGGMRGGGGGGGAGKKDPPPPPPPAAPNLGRTQSSESAYV
ncbi:CXD2 protein, partial [Polyodon spathula]|nr:CXD2 protein [Polyodon spathula]